MDFNRSYNVFGENYNIDDLQPVTELTTDNEPPTIHDDVAAENHIPQPDTNWHEHSLVTLRTGNIWQDHQRIQFQQQVNTWNMMSYRMWETKQQQHPIPVFGNAWSLANHMSLKCSCAAPTDNVYICPGSQVHCLEHKSFFVPSYIPIPTHTLSTTPKSTSKSSNIEKQKRTRINYTNEQLLILESIFQNHKYLNKMMRECLANELGITEKQVKTWFQNRRVKKTKG